MKRVKFAIAGVVSVAVMTLSHSALADQSNKDRYDALPDFKQLRAGAKKSEPPSLQLRPAFAAFKQNCLLQAPRMEKELNIDTDIPANLLCGCAASHAQVTGMPDKIMEQVVARLNAGDWHEVGAHEDYEYVLEYCLQEAY